MQKTKIVATIGPASEKSSILEAMVDAGMDVARINFSHGTHESNGAAIAAVRAAAAARGGTVAVLADLQGPRVRTVVARPVAVMQGAVVAIVGAASPDDVTAAEARLSVPVIGFDEPTVAAALRPGHQIFVEDGLKQMVVVDCRDDGTVLAQVRVGGEIANHKGVNLPDTDVPLPAVSAKDEADLAFALTQDVEYIAMSFVRTAEDVAGLRARIAALQPDAARRPGIVVKMERPEAVIDMEDIVAATDAVMVARGDLATEAGQERVGVLQKAIVRCAQRYLRPVIVATQMLASMEHSPRPTRAEINDVTNAVVDHADAVMLSGESANGDFPVESVATMNEIIRQTELSPYDDVTGMLPDDASPLAAAAWRTVEHARGMEAAAIVVPTADGALARAVAHYRPGTRIVALTPDPLVRRQLALVWGVEAYEDPRVLAYHPHDLLEAARTAAAIRGTAVLATTVAP